ncbi:hypothetical protein MMC26_004649 [Xylographa opegraphella]|nr:hypothetical protein [Xylographa opegraphella]
MSWLRRLSRDRNSKGEQDFQQQKPMSFRPSSSYADNNSNHNTNQPFSPLKDSQFSSSNHNSQDMLQSYRRAAPQDQYSSQGRPLDSSSDAVMHNTSANIVPAPDPLTRVFNEAIKPYVEQIDILKNDLEDANQRIQELENERAEMHSWIDKRGLRPDLTPHLAATMSSSPVAASTFASQLERKMTMLNYDLHRLADSLPSPIPMSTVTITLSTLVPPIAHLSTLSQGAPQAFELLIKLAGNLNSHITGEENESDSKTIAEFYTLLDQSMVDIIRQRLEQSNAGQESPEWMIPRDVKRIEKTGDLLGREMGLRNYFVRSLDVLRYEIKRGEGMTRYSP